MNLEQKQYPIGRFEYGKLYTPSETGDSFDKLRILPSRLKNVVSSLFQIKYSFKQIRHF